MKVPVMIFHFFNDQSKKNNSLNLAGGRHYLLF